MENKTIPSPYFPKTQIFVGPQSSGKKAAALLIGSDKKVVNMPWYKKLGEDPYTFHKVEKDTDLIIIENVPLKKLEETLMHLMNTDIQINRQSRNSFVMRRPHTILICDSEGYSWDDGNQRFRGSLMRRFEIVQFPQIDKQLLNQ
ncbi:hypothetical protein [Dyadobacter diqingensis]|uniref:hypothetical protein n=1 Tax=Dyadobacter diqingensis TaxID=2938121 RepID=UPI0020C59066|nr:hypothetical protein [Dyadobacter diqingensis]